MGCGFAPHDGRITAVNTTVTEKPAAVSAATTLRVTEIFHSLQGETSRTGLPTVFVRLTGCPLRCGYCDTAYAFHGGESLTLDEILSRVAALGAHYVTLTGGEPLAQKSGAGAATAPCRRGLFGFAWKPVARWMCRRLIRAFRKSSI